MHGLCKALRLCIIVLTRKGLQCKHGDILLMYSPVALQHAAVQRAQSPDTNGQPGCNDVTEEELARHEADREAAKVSDLVT